MIPFGERNPLRCSRELKALCLAERNHQGTGNVLFDGGEPRAVGAVECQERLSGLLEHYRRAA